ncbi:MAG: hypothetical protein WAM94_14105 [Chromatiaceae bacterium]
MAEVRSATPELERFARETLGCNCAPEVFSRVEDDRSPPPGCPEILRRIAIGGRLLIYVAEPADAELAARRMGAWIAAGRTELDRRGMNRLRLVVSLGQLTTEDVAVIESAFSQVPELAPIGAPGEEPRIHLHCLPRAALASI